MPTWRLIARAESTDRSGQEEPTEVVNHGSEKGYSENPRRLSAFGEGVKSYSGYAAKAWARGGLPIYDTDHIARTQTIDLSILNAMHRNAGLGRTVPPPGGSEPTSNFGNQRRMISELERINALNLESLSPRIDDNRNSRDRNKVKNEFQTFLLEMKRNDEAKAGNTQNPTHTSTRYDCSFRKEVDQTHHSGQYNSHGAYGWIHTTEARYFVHPCDFQGEVQNGDVVVFTIYSDCWGLGAERVRPHRQTLRWPPPAGIGEPMYMFAEIQEAEDIVATKAGVETDVDSCHLPHGCLHTWGLIQGNPGGPQMMPQQNFTTLFSLPEVRANLGTSTADSRSMIKALDLQPISAPSADRMAQRRAVASQRNTRADEIQNLRDFAKAQKAKDRPAEAVHHMPAHAPAAVLVQKPTEDGNPQTLPTWQTLTELSAHSDSVEPHGQLSSDSRPRLTEESLRHTDIDSTQDGDDDSEAKFAFREPLLDALRFKIIGYLSSIIPLGATAGTGPGHDSTLDSALTWKFNSPDSFSQETLTFEESVEDKFAQGCLGELPGDKLLEQVVTASLPFVDSDRSLCTKAKMPSDRPCGAGRRRPSENSR